MYSTGTCARVLRGTVGTVSAAHHQFSTASQSSRCPQLSLCLQQGISATRPQNGSEGFLSRVESFRHLFQSWKRCERVLLLRYFPRYPSFSMDYFILFLLLYAWYAWLQNGCCERSGVRRTAPFSHSHSLSLSLSLSHSCHHPPFSQFLTAPPHPFIFYLFLSFPLVLTDTLRYALLWLFTITVVPLPTMSTRKIRLPKSRGEQIAPDEYERLNRSFFAGGSNICKLSSVTAKTATKLPDSAKKWPQSTLTGNLTIHN